MIEEIGVSEKPAWLDLPEKQSYWGCAVTYRKNPWWGRNRKCMPVWRILCYSPEDAEAYAVRSIRDHGGGTFESARERNLSAEMHKVRMDGDLGIEVLSYRDGAWRTVKKYPAEIPLPTDDLP